MDAYFRHLDATQGRFSSARRAPMSSFTETMRPRKDIPEPDPVPPVADRAWASRKNLHERDASKDLVRFTALPAETGPTFAPDRLSIWPVEGGRFGIDAHYHGESGAQRAAEQLTRLTGAGIPALLRHEPGEDATLRLGPLAHSAAWVALRAFLGEPLDLAE